MMTPTNRTLVIVQIFFIYIISNTVSASLPECSKVVSEPTPGNPLYSHSELFGATATPKDVEALKYYCLNDLIRTILTEQMNNTVASPHHELHLNCTNATMKFKEKLMNDTSEICELYLKIKAYQYMLHQSLKTDIAAVLKSAIKSVLYLLQNLGESLQAIQYANNKSYCRDYVGNCQEYHIYQILVASHHDNVKSVLTHLKNRRPWRFYSDYERIFKSSACIQYDSHCDFYTSLYRSVTGIQK